MSYSDIYELDENTRKAGISYENAPVAKRFGVTNAISYPCVIIDTGTVGALKHQLESLKNLSTANLSDLTYPLYIWIGETLSNIGTIDAKSLKVLLTSPIFNTWEIAVQADANTVHTDDTRLAYCSYL